MVDIWKPWWNSGISEGWNMMKHDETTYFWHILGNWGASPGRAAPLPRGRKNCKPWRCLEYGSSLVDVDLDIVVVVTAVKHAICNKIRVMNIWPDYGLWFRSYSLFEKKVRRENTSLPGDGHPSVAQGMMVTICYNGKECSGQHRYQDEEQKRQHNSRQHGHGWSFFWTWFLQWSKQGICESLTRTS